MNAGTTIQGRKRHGRLRGARRSSKNFPAASRGYVLLETVVATGLLLLGLSVIGAQFQQAQKTIRTMNHKLRGMMLAEMQFAHLDLGLIELATVDAVEEEDFGPRYPDWGWRLTIEETAIDKMYLLRGDILYMPREDYESEEFDFDHAEIVHTLYSIRTTPQPLDFTSEFGLTEEQAADLTDKLAGIGEGLDAAAMDPSILADLSTEELIEVLPLLLQAFGVSLEDIRRQIPPEFADQLEKLGLDQAALEGQGGTPGGQEGANPETEAPTGDDEGVEE